jgi:hypothetical protein
MVLRCVHYYGSDTCTFLWYCLVYIFMVLKRVHFYGTDSCIFLWYWLVYIFMVDSCTILWCWDVYICMVLTCDHFYGTDTCIFLCYWDVYIFMVLRCVRFYGTASSLQFAKGTAFLQIVEALEEWHGFTFQIWSLNNTAVVISYQVLSNLLRQPWFRVSLC